MPNINLFVEDRGHEAFIRALVGRFAKQYRIPVKTSFESAKGGHGKVISKLKGYISDLQNDQEYWPDLLIVATDGNCKGFLERKQEIDNAMKGFSGQVIYAIPDPHIERWLLLDSSKLFVRNSRSGNELSKEISQNFAKAQPSTSSRLRSIIPRPEYGTILSNI